jgi:hypothetical protein
MLMLMDCSGLSVDAVDCRHQAVGRSATRDTHHPPSGPIVAGAFEQALRGIAASA